MDSQLQDTQQISDDQELAKVLEGVSKMGDGNLGFEETPVPTPMIVPDTTSMPDMATDNVVPTTTQMPTIGYNQPPQVMPVSDNNNLDDIKKDALVELRPLVDKLDLAPEEKFDIYLLLLRSTDDKALIAPAHAAARNIADEVKRAQALLDIIKEIDYLSGPSQPAI